ncbi:TraI domain-containing protein [Methylomonas sp. AM2-LC]|uniref:TraI domain-containing protein n=1 Tax=Methylomonas sp. AM2-LC TaxID=3153301 RepID=UPI003263C5C9
MIKKLFNFKTKPGKNKIDKALNKSMPISNDEIFKWTSERNKTIHAFPIEFIINHETNAELIKEIKMATGMAGSHNKDKAEVMLMRPIRQLVNLIHLLPASEFEHFNHPCGLFTLCLEASLRSIHRANRRILTRVTPEIRRENEDLWTYAAFLNGLFSEAIATISNLTVFGEDNLIKWRPTKEPLAQWLCRNNHKQYRIHWKYRPDFFLAYTLADNIIDGEQLQMLQEGVAEPAISSTLVNALHNPANLKNPLTKINSQVVISLKARNMKDHQNQPLAGRHLVYWLTNALEALLKSIIWVAKEEFSPIWGGDDGVFLVWPLAAKNINSTLRDMDCPYIPDTQEKLAEILLDVGIIESNEMNEYLFDIAIPVADSPEKKYLKAVKASRTVNLLFAGRYKALQGNVQC